MKGAYILELWLDYDKQITIGKLGVINFKKGRYFYVGSSQNNVEKRIAYHMKDDKKIHWHIDYLTTSKDFIKIQAKIFESCKKEKECEISADLGKKYFSIDGFGCSDCRCKSHLFYDEKLN
jgi:Uri superfamily endonuclease